MNKNVEYYNYTCFIHENFPNSGLLKSDDGLVKKLFICIHDSLVISEILSGVKKINSTCIKLLEDQKLIYLKTLYILPTNDEFQFYSIMRANVENLLRILLCAFKSEMSYEEIKKTNFSLLNNLLDSTYLNKKYKKEISELYSFFGTFSKNIHKITYKNDTILHLKEMMNESLPPRSLEIKITSLEKIKNTLINVFLDVYKIESNSLDTSQLSRLHSILGDDKYAKLPFFKI